MIGKLLNIIKDDLNAFFIAQGNLTSGTEIFSFPDLSKSGGQSDPILNGESMNLFLVNLEENRSHRPAEMYYVTQADGGKRTSFPPIKLDIYFAVASKFKDYPTALDNLTLCIKYFMSHRYLDSNVHPDFPDDVDQIIVEMIPMTFEIQRQVWSILQIAYLPCALYRMGLLITTNDQNGQLLPTVKEIVGITGPINS